MFLTTKGRKYMTKALIRLFVKEYENVDKVSVRTAYGVLSSMVGIFCNAFLFAIKIGVAFLTGSVSIMADAFNNLSDAGTSVIGYAGMKMAEMPADKRHPFGHGRVEYITALIVSFIVIEVGFTFFKDSVGRIRHPEEMRFHLIPVLLLLVSIFVKLWLGTFNRYLGTQINSQVMMAAAADSAGDVITTSATIISMLIWKFAGINIDGIVGVGVSLVVMWAGVGIAKDTLRPLIGEPVTKEECDKIEKFVEKYPGVIGSHDLIVHNYGPGRSMASIHAEVPNNLTLEKAHSIVDHIERAAEKELGMQLVIHIDPVETKDREVLQLRQLIEQTVNNLDEKCDIHDFRIIEDQEIKNLIFDFVIPRDYSFQKGEELMVELMDEIQGQNEKYCCIITLEQSYIEE